MKFRVPALCLAGVLVTCAAAWADHADHSKMTDKASPSMHPGDRSMAYDRDMGYDYYNTDGSPKGHHYYSYAGEDLIYRQVFFPDLPSEGYVARKVSQIAADQQNEIAHLEGFAQRAHSVGFENISTVYDTMVGDHQRIVDRCANWLAVRDYPSPPAVVAINAADVRPETTVEEVIDMHVKAFNRALDEVHTERSSTIRGLELWSAATALRHISWLETLGRDVQFGRHTMSALLNSELTGSALTLADVTQVTEEELRIAGLTLIPGQPQYVQVDKEVEVPTERVVVREIPAPQPPAVVQAPPPPAPVITQTPVESRVAARRISRRAARRRAAK
jgi:hypothetical protein